jgi:oleandomycin transport system permease protein
VTDAYASLLGVAPPDRAIGVLRASAVLARRVVQKTMRTPEALIDVTAQPVLILLLFVYLFAGAVSGSRHEYLQYLVPGIVVQTVLIASLAIGVELHADLSRGVDDRFRSLPIPRIAPLAGAVLAAALRFVLAVVVTVGFGAVLGFRSTEGPISLLLGCMFAVGFALCACWYALYVGLVARSPSAVGSLVMPVLFLFTFGSDVFVMPRTLPGWLHGVVVANPVSCATDAVRALLTGGPLGTPLLASLGWMAASLSLLGTAAARAYRRRG